MVQEGVVERYLSEERAVDALECFIDRESGVRRDVEDEDEIFR